MLACLGQRRCWRPRQRPKRSASSARPRLHLSKRWERRRLRRWGWKLRPTSSTERLPKQPWSWRRCPRSAAHAGVVAAVTRSPLCYMGFPRVWAELSRVQERFYQKTSVCVQIAGKVAAPLSRTNEIVILSGEGSRVTGEVNRLLAELPVSVNALTGVDLTKVRVAPCSVRCPCILFSWFSPPSTDASTAEDGRPNRHMMTQATNFALWILQRVSASSMKVVSLFYFSLLANFLCPGTLDSNQVCLFFIYFSNVSKFSTETNRGSLLQKDQIVCILCCFYSLILNTPVWSPDFMLQLCSVLQTIQSKVGYF